VVDAYADMGSTTFGSQELLVEMIACYVLHTWFLPACRVAGYLWTYGDKGSGKSHLLETIASLSYLGQLLISGTTYPALRDLADAGACLCFDDIEQILNPRQADPDKRSMALAGNKPHVKAHLMEKTYHGYKRRAVRVFCARAFSATSRPDAVLESRCIIVHMLRSQDTKKGKTDPSDYIRWPVNYFTLRDDLWLLTLKHLKDVSKFSGSAMDGVRIWGRPLEPWVGILTVAKWLESKGVMGLWKRMEELSWDYQDYRGTVMDDDPTTLVAAAIVALCENPPRDPAHYYHITHLPSVRYYIKTDDILEWMRENIDSDSFNSTYYTTHRIGRILRKLGISTKTRSKESRERAWEIPHSEYLRINNTYTYIEGGKKGTSGQVGKDSYPLCSEVGMGKVGSGQESGQGNFESEVGQSGQAKSRISMNPDSFRD